MVKRLSDWTYQDMVEYRNYRACDGNWGLMTALAFLDFSRNEPHYFMNRTARLEKWWRHHRWQLLNLDLNPLVNIITGEVVSGGANENQL